jgi:L-fuconolactonase
MPTKETLNGSSESQGAPAEEMPLDPARPIVDPHHHLWEFSSEFWSVLYRDGRRPPPRFFLPEAVAMIARGGHKITHTVVVECHAMYRSEGPEELRAIGETEFINGIAAMSASGGYGPCRVAAGIVAAADLRLGDAVRPVLEAQVAAGNGRLRGIRASAGYAEDLLELPPNTSLQGLLTDAAFRRGVAALESLDLSLDVWCVHTQIGDVASLAAACPGVTIILDHLGSPLTFGPYAGREDEVFASWKESIIELARRPNVVLKLGGLGSDLSVSLGTRVGNETSALLSTRWRPYIETCIAAFGAERCMFESNFPPDSATCTYGALWNTFKRIVADYSEAEKSRLFAATARRIYRI